MDDGRSCAFADIDGDGDLDLAANTLQGFRLYKNEMSNQNSCVQVILKSRMGQTPPIYAKLYITGSNGKKQVRYYMPNTGFLTQVSETIYFGMGGDRGPVSLKVFWPDIKKEIQYDRLPVDHLIAVFRDGSHKILRKFAKRKAGLPGIPLKQFLKTVKWPELQRGIGLLLNNKLQGTSLKNFLREAKSNGPWNWQIKVLAFPDSYPALVAVNKKLQGLLSLDELLSVSKLWETLKPYHQPTPFYLAEPYGDPEKSMFAAGWSRVDLEKLLARFPHQFFTIRKYLAELKKGKAETAKIKEFLQKELRFFPEPEWQGLLEDLESGK
ncbi:ASPIC/UnbV domain-containing protein [Candidatus Riflebacteria bacterium]